MFRPFAFILGLIACGLPVAAADYADPTWPCVQRKVDNLSLGLMWSLPLDTTAPPVSEEQADAINELGGLLSLRRVALSDLGDEIDSFASRYEGDPQALGLVFVHVFDNLSQRRARIMSGIADFSLGQIALSEKIDESRVEMDALMARDDPDFDRVDQLEEQIDWDTVIYTDRQRNIAYLCETPTLLEKRLFEIAQLLQAAAKQ